MKLTYRGTSYESTSAQEANTQSVAPVDLRYRGATYRYNQNARAESLNAILKYRGVAYSTQPTAQTITETAPAVAVATPVAVASASVDDQARLLNIRHQRSIKNRQQSLLSRVASEIGLDTIGNYWNRIQGKVHPTFRVNYDRSHVTFS
jgi:hypothetical protein